MKYLVKSLKNNLYTLAVVCYLSSCYVPSQTGVPLYRQEENIYYIPSTPVSTTFLEKNDLNFNIMHSFHDKFSGVEAQGAYLLSKHVGVITAYTYASNKDGYEKYMNFNRFEIGAGYVKSLPKNWHFETYAGGGFGKATNYHATGLSHTGLGIFFIQPAFGVHDKNKTVSFDIVSKFSGVNFNVKDTSFKTGEEGYSAAQMKALHDKPFNMMWEPALIFRAGWKKFLFNISYTGSVNLSNSDLNQSKGNLSLGISFIVNTKKELNDNINFKPVK